MQLLKFHGTYQQDSRDQRRGRQAAGEDKAYSFMVRVAIPAGADHRRAVPGLDAIADRHANGTLRVTTRQGFQFHGVLKGDLKPTIAGINQELLTTIAACGDVQRNVMGCSAPLADADHAAVRAVAEALAGSSRPPRAPITRSGSRARSRSPPSRRSRSTATSICRASSRPAVGLSIDNCVDIYSQDVGLLAIVERRAGSAGFNLLVGGGLGMTHNKADTTARLAEPLGFVPTAHGVEAVRIVAAIFRDHGNRSDRRHARLKYLIAEWGIERFREEFQPARVVRARARPSPSRRCRSTTTSGGIARLTDAGSTASSSRAGASPTPRAIQLKTALREIVDRFRPGVRLTGAAEPAAHRSRRRAAWTACERLLRQHGVTPAGRALGGPALLDGLPGAAHLRTGRGRIGAGDPGHPRSSSRPSWQRSGCATRRSPSG